jgi:hypothetical protein
MLYDAKLRITALLDHAHQAVIEKLGNTAFGKLDVSVLR